MQLMLKRSQKMSQGFSPKVVFCLDARAYLTPEEEENVRRYKLGPQIIYSSEISRKHAEQAASVDGGTAAGFAKGALHLIAAKLALNISIEGLYLRGEHIECKSLDELLSAEEALMNACENLKAYLAAAATFDGREVLLDFNSREPRVVAPVVTPSALPPPSAPIAVHMDAAPPPMPASAATMTMDSPAFGQHHDGTAKTLPEFLAMLKERFDTLTTPQQIGVGAAGLLLFIFLVTRL